MTKPYEKDGVLHATIADESGTPHRFHLRLNDPTEQNYLWIDGQGPPLILDPTAAEFVELLIDAMWKFQQGDGDETEKVVDYVVSEMVRRHTRFPRRRGPVRRRVTDDFHRLVGTLMRIAGGACPAEAGLEPRALELDKWAAPARMDLAVTYRCNVNCGHCYVGEDRGGIEELPTESWIEILDRLWRIGVPQVVFTGGEPLVRESARGDLVRLVARAEKFVTGLVTNGILLDDYAEKLLDANLDYTQVTVESSDPAVHNTMVGAEGALAKTEAGIRKVLSLGMHVTTNTTLTRDNAATFLDTIRWGHALGLRSMACNTLICSGRGVAHRKEKGLAEAELVKLLAEARGLASSLGVQLQWYSPTCYRELNPVELGFGIKSCSAAQHNMTVQPDGTVLPCQSWPDAVGNILADEWPKIWNNDLCLKLRKHSFAPDKCEACEFIASCGGGCPLDNAGREEVK